MDTVRYVTGVLLVISLPPALLWWFVVHPFIGFWRQLGVKTSMSIFTVLALAGAGGLFTVRDALLGRDLGTHWLLVGLAAVLFSAAAVLSVKRRRELTFGILAGLPELEAEPARQGRLLSRGLYAQIRHPRYVEVVIGVLAYAVLSNHVGGYVLALVTVPVLHAIVVLEERELLDRFGEEYEEYRRSVPRYIPRAGS